MKNIDKFGLSDEILQEISTILGRYPLTKAVLFGSRVKGDYSDNSDIDIAIWTDDQEIEKYLRTDLEEEVTTARKFDLINFKSLDNHKLKENILREGIAIPHHSTDKNHLTATLVNRSPNPVGKTP